MEFKLINRKFFGIFVLTLLILSFAMTANAVNKFTVTPKGAVSLKNESNFYNVKTTEREVQTTYIEPGIDLGFETSKSAVSLDYTLIYEDYDYKDPPPDLADDWERQNDIDHFTGQSLQMFATTQPFDKLTLGLEDGFLKSRETSKRGPYEHEDGKIEYSQNQVAPILLYKLNENVSTELRYIRSMTDYDLTTYDDSTENKGAFNLIYTFSPTFSMDFGYQKWKRDYGDLIPDYTSDQANLNLKKQFRYSSIEAGAGYQTREFDNEMEDIDTFTYQISIDAKNPPDGDTRSYLKFTVSQNFNDHANYFKAQQYILEIGHVFLEKISLDFDTAYQNNDFEHSERVDDTIRYSGTLGYIFKDWITMNFSAGSEIRDSNILEPDRNDYKNKYVMLTVDAKYNVGSR